jgi:26S proteasome regulatory subunit T4
MDEERKRTLDEYRTELLKSRELESKLKDIRLEIRELQKEYERTEDSIKALQSVGQIIGEVLKQLPDERCKFPPACPIEMPSHSDPSPPQSSSRPLLAPVTSSVADPSSTRPS